ncbi:MAG: xanthine dehydrogenase family protein molybdopterin-binding subunit [Steroidobacteraceae bacterium]
MSAPQAGGPGSAESADVNAGRRHFLIGLGVVAAGTGIGIRVMPGLLASGRPAAAPFDFKPHAFVRISSDDSITVIIGKSEMGQGVYTGLPMVLAEELDVNPQRISVEFAPVDPAFNHTHMPGQFTGASSSTQTTFEPLRRVGATARAMLLAAAAKRWGVGVDALETADGGVLRRGGLQRASYGALAEAAAAVPMPQDVPLRERAAFRYIGKPQKRLDGRAKVTGAAKFGSDVQLPDMLVATVARAPVFGATVQRFDDRAARAVPGVVDVRQVPSGVAVYARHTWAALKGREALRVDWNPAPGGSLSTDAMRAEWRALAERRGVVTIQHGDVDRAFAAAAKQATVEYELPYLAHACMEPLNAVAHVTPGRCELWVGTQNQSQDAQFVAKALGLAPADVTLHTTFLGGGFGRRASTTSDFSVEAAHVANGMGRPVRTLWTREDDMRGGYYRPMAVNRVHIAVDAQGKALALEHTVVGKPLMKNSPFAAFAFRNGIDPSSIEGLGDTVYAVPNLRQSAHYTDEPVPILWWRSVGHSINAFIENAAVDEMAALAGRDPLEFRRELLAGRPRHLAVLEKAAAAAGWGAPLPPGRFHGIALHESFRSIVAEVVELSVDGDGAVSVHRVTCAVDCGFAVNPDQVVAQMQSAIVFGLSAALYGEITLEAGRPVQGNFDGYRVLRISEAPAIDVHIVESDGPLGGVGEPGLPPVAPAVCGAIFAATGKRVRRLPVRVGLASA